MILEFLRRQSVPILAIGASIIIGFLAFSGMYVLWPLLPLAIVAFVLSIAYEGEIYYQNLKGAFDKLFNANYLKEQLAKECLRELLPRIEEENFLHLDKLTKQLKTLETLRNLTLRIKDGTPRNKLKKHYAAFLLNYEKYTNAEKQKLRAVKPLEDSMLSLDDFINFSDTDVTACLNDISSKLETIYQDDPQPFFNDFFRLLRIYHQYDAPNLSGYKLKCTGLFSYLRLNKRTILLSRKKGEIFYSLIAPDDREILNYPSGIKAPKPFTLEKLNELKAQILAVAQKNGHAHPDHRDDKQKLKKSLQTLEQVFVNQLFESSSLSTGISDKETSHESKQYLKTLQRFLNKSFALSELTENEFESLEKQIKHTKLIKFATKDSYKSILFNKKELQQLKKALPLSKESQKLSTKLVNDYRDVWQGKLKKRRVIFRLTKMVSGVAAIFMMLGTSFLLVEAFSVFPFMATISFSIWPVFIVPMAIVAGIAFGLLTFNAITDMINDDIILKRYRKLKDDWNKGLTFKSGLMLIATISLMVLTIALTICTAGTWWTVIKHTRPIFAFMRNLPAAVVGIAAGVLGLATLAFNVGNTLETLEEFDEEAGPHPYDIGLMELDENATLPTPKSLKRSTLIKQDHRYWMIGSLDGKKWQCTQLPNHCFDQIDFDKAYLPFRWQNIYTYFTIKRYQAHTFVPSRKNWLQWANPIRLLLKLTYTPLRIGLFLGHLVSIGVMADRLPGIPEVLSALLGIISEFFEDWHYFFSFSHAHRDDIQSLYDEYTEKMGGHDHTDDLPTRVLRLFFYPLIYLAAWWDNHFSDLKEDLPPLRKYSSYWSINEHDKALSFEEALDNYLGLKTQPKVMLDEEDSTYIQIAQRLPAKKSTAPNRKHATPIAHPIILEAKQEQSFLVDNLAKMAHEEKDPSKMHNKDFSNFFKKRSCCANHTFPENQHTLAIPI